MKKHFSGKKAGFIGKSLLWSLMLYGCFVGITHWSTVAHIFGKNEKPVTYVSSSNDNIQPVRISLDSMQKGIRIAEGALRQLSIYISKR